jgi:hypothetical protein
LNLKELLALRQMSGNELAKACKHPQGTIYGILSGRRSPSISLGQEIAKAMNSELIIEGERFGWKPLPQPETPIVVPPAELPAVATSTNGDSTN